MGVLELTPEQPLLYSGVTLVSDTNSRFQLPFRDKTIVQEEELVLSVLRLALL